MPILTEQEGKNVEFASMILLLSTVLSMVTIPVIVEFTKMVFWIIVMKPANQSVATYRRNQGEIVIIKE